MLQVEPIPPTGEKREIGAGVHPWWSTDQTELWYSPGPVGYFNVVPIMKRSSQSFDVGPPVQVPRQGYVGLGPTVGRNYDTIDSKRVLLVVTAGAQGAGPGPASISVVVNWAEELKARLP